MALTTSIRMQSLVATRDPPPGDWKFGIFLFVWHAWSDLDPVSDRGAPGENGISSGMQNAELYC